VRSSPPGTGAVPAAQVSWLRFVRAYVKSMRLYYSFVTGVAGWLGVAYYEHLASAPALRTIEIIPPPEKKLAILVILFLSWESTRSSMITWAEGRPNHAPDRPMVTGELHPGLALGVSGLLLLGAALVTWFFLQPLAMVFLAAGVLLNVVYEYARVTGCWAMLCLA